MARIAIGITTSMYYSMARAKAVTKIIVQVDLKLRMKDYSMLLMTETSADFLVEPYQKQYKSLR